MHAEDSLVHRRCVYNLVKPFLNERLRRILAAAEARALQRGGKTAIAKAFGMSRVTISRGSKELKSRSEKRAGYKTRVRRPRTHDRRRLHERDPGLATALEKLLAPRGDTRGPLHWTCQSTRALAGRLPKSHSACPRSVAAVLFDMGFSLQARRKPRSTSDKKRGEQYRYILAQVRRFSRNGQPVLWLTLREKQLSVRKEVESLRSTSNGHFILLQRLKRVLRNAVARRHAQSVLSEHGWMEAGFGCETLELAAGCIGEWWSRLGRREYARTSKILVVAEGGQAGRQLANWKPYLQELSHRLGRDLHVCHLPAGNTRWTDIRQTLATLNVTPHRGRPTLARLATVNVIGRPGHMAATPTLGARLDRTRYAAIRSARFAGPVGVGSWNIVVSQGAK